MEKSYIKSLKSWYFKTLWRKSSPKQMGTTRIDKELRFRLLSELDFSTETLSAKDNTAMLSKS